MSSQHTPKQNHLLAALPAADYARLHLAIELLLVQLNVATRLEKPELFADSLSNGIALAITVRLSMADSGTVIRQIRDTLRQHLPGLHGNRAAEYIEFALERLKFPELVAG